MLRGGGGLEIFFFYTSICFTLVETKFPTNIKCFKISLSVWTSTLFKGSIQFKQFQHLKVKCTRPEGLFNKCFKSLVEGQCKLLTMGYINDTLK